MNFLKSAPPIRSAITSLCADIQLWNILFALGLITPLALVLCSFLRPKTASGDTAVYSLFHLALNRRPGETEDKDPQTEWLNMGYWKDENCFPDACRALAVKLVNAARLQPGANILDVGFGTGESVLFLLSEDTVPRPAKITGITDMEPHCERARRRVKKTYPYLMSGKEPRVVLLTGDAVGNDSPDHPLSPSSNSKPFDAILALDCAYHFKTRRRFLEQSFARLSPNGRVALADICFSKQAVASYRTYITTSILRMMPAENRISEERYRQQMKEIGYTDVAIENITSDVFPPFIHFLKSQGWGWWLFGIVLQLYVLGSGAQFVLASGEKARDTMA